MSCIPTFSGSPALAANASASAEVAAKAWRLVTGVFIVHFLGATRSQSALVETRRFRRRPSKHGTTMYSSRNGRPMSEMGGDLNRSTQHLLILPDEEVFAWMHGPNPAQKPLASLTRDRHHFSEKNLARCRPVASGQCIPAAPPVPRSEK